tara:strand:- start:275 stop:853 length:579 start_codon:yes stop_codon:yes gene_type:complete
MDYLETIKDDDIYFLEIGAFDGKSFDGLYKYTHSNKWKGIFVEPIPKYFQQLKINFKNIENKFFENSAITEENKEYRIKLIEGKEKWAKGSSSLTNNDNTVKYGYSEQTINGITFDTLVKKYNIQKIDVLQIDTEGYDLIVLEQIIPRFKPKFIKVEQRHLKMADKIKMKAVLTNCGYTFKRVGLDYICLLA